MTKQETKEMLRILKSDSYQNYGLKGYRMIEFKKDEGVTKILKDGKIIAWVVDSEHGEDLFNGLRMWLRSGRIFRALQERE